MTTVANPRRHLVERAAEVLGHQHLADLPPPAESARPNPSQREVGVPLPPAAPLAAPPMADAGTPTTAREPESPSRPRPRPAPIPEEALRRAGFVTLLEGAKRSRITEELGVVQHQIMRTIQGTEPVEDRISHMVLVTSAKPGEGKTFCSVNIAVRLAMSTTAQVVLVDTDGAKKGSLSELLGQEASPGLDVLVSDPIVRPETLLVPTALRRLAFLPYGPPSEPSARPSGAMLARALVRLSAAMPGRVLIVDAPPCLATSEPTALASVAGLVVMVVRAESTQRSEVEAALDLVDGCPNLQLLLNRTILASRNTFGAYDYDGG